jgi:hypothetical protein
MKRTSQAGDLLVRDVATLKLARSVAEFVRIQVSAPASY